MKLIDLNELEKRLKSFGKPTPQDAVNIIMNMYKEKYND